MTSELRELVCVPIASSASRTRTSRPDTARARATASPTTPAPITTASTRSIIAFDQEDSRGKDYGASPPLQAAAKETGATGLEPATSGVTGRRSNQLNYAPEGRGIVAGRQGSKPQGRS